MKKQLNQAGFTIIELMIATVVFSMILLLCSYGLLSVGRTYYKGVTTTRTQEAARLVIDDIAQSIQFGSGTVYAPAEAGFGTAAFYCAGGKRYSYIRDQQVSGGRHGLVVDRPTACNGSTGAQDLVNPAVSLTSSSQEFIPTGMRLSSLRIVPVGTDLYRISVRVISGDTDLLNAAHDNCLSVRAGSQYCAMSELTTVVQKRVR